MSLLVNAYSTLVDPPALDFPHQLNNRRDLSDPELAPHLNGFVGFIMRERPQMTATLYATMRHIQRVRNHLSFNLEEEALDALSHWAWEANAILFMRDGTVLNPGGRELVDSSGVPHEAELPYPKDALERRERTSQRLAELGLATPASLPPVVSEREVVLRDARDVAHRMYSLLAVAVRAESLASGEPLEVAALREKLPLAFEALSPVEQAFLDSDEPAQQDVVNHAWRYEALFLLQWALGLFDEMPMPTKICDVPAVAGALFGRNGREVLKAAKLRPTSQILDVHDLLFRLHWLAREAIHNKNEPPPAELDPGVIQERRHALGWLVQFEDADWDDVDTPT
ncbi:MAG: DUF4272 domain-containing protein [Polyangiaceae bacterium]